MMQTNFLERLESFAHSLSETLERTIGKIDEMLQKIDQYAQKPSMQDAETDVLPDDDAELDATLKGAYAVTDNRDRPSLI